MTVPALSASIEVAFRNYEKIQDNLLLQLNRIFFGEDTQRYVVLEDGHISIADFIKNSPKPEELTTLKEILERKENELAIAKATLEQKEEALSAAMETYEQARVALEIARAGLEIAQTKRQIARDKIEDAEREGDAEKLAEGQAELQTAEEKILDAQNDVAQKQTTKNAAEEVKNAAEAEKNQAEQAKNEAQIERDQAKLAATRGFNAFTDCDESTAAYKFYGNQIIDQINKLSDYINEAKAILDKWNMLSGNDLSSLIHADVVHLECLDQFCYEIHQKFGSRYYYDFDEDNWKLAEDDYNGYDPQTGMTYEQIEDEYSTYDALYQTKVKSNHGDETSPGKVLECFNELNLLDRLKYIKVYYDIKNGKTNYVFPGSKEFGYPCVAEKGIEDTDARIANLEKFYLGYLVDRDGPVNAFCSLYEVKVWALQETLNEMSNRIKALNVYMDFINRGLELLNQIQSDKEIEENIEKIPDGVTIALTYLCGQKMYNLFEYEGEKYLVIPSVKEDEKYVCVKADESGMRFLMGDGICNGTCVLVVKGEGEEEALWRARCQDLFNEPIPQSVQDLNRSYFAGDSVGSYYCTRKQNIKNFLLPKALDVATVDPKSVKNYLSGTLPTGNGKKAQERTTIFESWTAAFNKKIGFINDAIDIVKTDIEQIRNKIDTYQSQANTFRNRVQDVYINSIRKIKS